MTKLLSILACVAIIVCLGAIARGDANSPAEEPNKSAGQPPKKLVAAIVNGQEITEDQVDALVKPQLERLAAQMPAAFVEQYKSQLRSQMLDRMVAEKLLDEEVKKQNATITEQDVNDRLNQIASQQRLSMDDLKALIQANGQTFDQVKGNIRRGLGYQKLIAGQFAGKINVTAEDANKYYQENKPEFQTSEEVKASHILIKPDVNVLDPNADPNQAKAAAKQKAQQLLDQIKAGADFAELAKANSVCPSAARGGDLGFFSKEKMVPEFEQTAFNLKVGQVSDIVETKFGYHIIKVTDRKEAGVTSFQEAKQGIIDKLTGQKQNELTYQYIESLRSKAKITYPGKEAEQVNEPIVEGVTVEDIDSNKPK